MCVCFFFHLNYIVKSTFDIDTQHNAEAWVRKEKNEEGTHWVRMMRIKVELMEQKPDKRTRNI